MGTTGQRADSILDRTAWSTSCSKSDGEQSRRAAAESRPGPRARGGGRLVLHLAPAQPCCADLDNDPSSSRDRPGASLSRRSELWSPSSSSSPFTAPLASISSTRTRLAQGSARQLPGPSLTPLWPRQPDPRPTKAPPHSSTRNHGLVRLISTAPHSARPALDPPRPPRSASTMSAASNQFGSLIFCSRCGTLLDLPGDEDHLVCSGCGQVEDAQGPSLFALSRPSFGWPELTVTALAAYEGQVITTKSNPAAFPSSLRQLKSSLVKGRGEVEKKKVYVRRWARSAMLAAAATTADRLPPRRAGRRGLREVRREADVGQDDAAPICRYVHVSPSLSTSACPC